MLTFINVLETAQYFFHNFTPKQSRNDAARQGSNQMYTFLSTEVTIFKMAVEAVFKLNCRDRTQEFREQY